MAIDAFGISAYQKATSNKTNKRNRKSNNISSISKNNEYLNDDNNDPYKDIERAESILKYMHDLNEHGNFDVIPNNVAYNTIISAYARISSVNYPDAPMHAESVLRRMIEMSDKNGKEDVAPDTRSYNALIRCWANAKQRNSGVRAEWWLRRMQDNCEVDNTTPDINTYNSVILAFQNVCQPAEAENLLEELIQMKDESELKPNSETFSLVIRTWLKYAKDGAENDAVHGCRRAFKWLSILLEKEDEGQDITSSPELFSQIISTVEISTRRTRKEKSFLNIALQTFSKLQSSRHHIDVTAYKCLLQTGIRTLSGNSNRKGREKFVRTVISSCCDDGLISRDVIYVLSDKFHLSQSEQNEIKTISKEFFGDWPLPINWSRNVKQQHLKPSKRDCARFQT
jgi:hypothetical protein